MSALKVCMVLPLLPRLEAQGQVERVAHGKAIEHAGQKNHHVAQRVQCFRHIDGRLGGKPGTGGRGEGALRWQGAGETAQRSEWREFVSCVPVCV